jgi:hypothetical protein
MKNEKLYKETVDIILDAYNERKLEHGDPCACFIGNIVAKRYAVKPAIPILRESGATPEYSYSPDWYTASCFKYRYGTLANFMGVKLDEEEGEKQIEATGYTLQEVAEMEKAFEDAECIEEGYVDDGEGKNIGQLEGMKAALKVLAKIHETMPEESLTRLQEIHEKVYA